MPVRVKVCCISSAEEADIAIRLGADAVGLVAEMPSGPGPIPNDRIREIALGIPATIASFLLTSRTRGEDIATHIQHCCPSTVQIVNHIDPGEYATVTRRFPATRRVQVIHIEGRGALDLARTYESRVHSLLLDSGRPDADRKELGGTGRTHDWDISAEIVRQSRIPVFLAGGLTAENVAEAVSRVRPFGVDICSGVRTGGKLDADKLSAFMDVVRGFGPVHR